MRHGQTVIKVKGGRTVSLPAWVTRRFGMRNGGFVSVRETRNGVLLKPATPANEAQAWFWTRRWQRMEREVDAEIRRGRLRRSRNLRELVHDLRA